MGNKIGKTIVLIVGIFLALIISLQSLQDTMSDTSKVEDDIDLEEILDIPIESVEVAETADINNTPFVDNMDLYQYDTPDSIVYMYVTIRKGNSSDGTDHSWQEVNDFTKFFFTNSTQTTVGKAEVIFQVGDESGPVPGNFGFGEINPNGTIQVRGNTASMVAQKSYKIELFDSAGEWYG